ncbi:MAG: Holliday junction resolvase RuvX [Bacteroidota bacterium]
MGRILAIDYGTKKTGLAVTDPMKIVASPMDTIPTYTLIDFLKNYLSKEAVECIVIGDPRRLNGEMSETTHLTNQFVNKLKKEIPEIKIVRMDERFTSKIAEKSVISMGLPKMKRQDKSLIDKVSATILLQDYMNTLAL